jgi:hypothetical protein
MILFLPTKTTMNELTNLEFQRDFGEYEEMLEQEEPFTPEEVVEADFEGEILQTFNDTDDALYTLADEFGEDRNYLKMRPHFQVPDSTFAA